MKTSKEKKSAEQIYEGIKLTHKINGHCSICYPCLESIKAEATKAEKERILNELAKIDNEKFKDEVHCTCLAYAIDKIENNENI